MLACVLVGLAFLCFRLAGRCCCCCRRSRDLPFTLLLDEINVEIDVDEVDANAVADEEEAQKSPARKRAGGAVAGAVPTELAQRGDAAPPPSLSTRPPSPAARLAACSSSMGGRRTQGRMGGGGGSQGRPRGSGRPCSPPRCAYPPHVIEPRPSTCGRFGPAQGEQLADPPPRSSLPQTPCRLAPPPLPPLPHQPRLLQSLPPPPLRSDLAARAVREGSPRRRQSDSGISPRGQALIRAEVKARLAARSNSKR